MPCAYGAEPQPGAPTYVYIDPLSAKTLFTSAVYAFLAPAILALDVRQVEVAALCSLDQPVPGAFPTTDFLLWLALGSMGAPKSWAAVSGWIDTWIKAKLWSSYCQCAGAPSGGSCPSPFSTSHDQVFSGLIAFASQNLAANGNPTHFHGDTTIAWQGGGANQTKAQFSVHTSAVGNPVRVSTALTAISSGGHVTGDIALVAGDQYVEVDYSNVGTTEVNETTTWTFTGCPEDPVLGPAPTAPSRPTGLPDAPAYSFTAVADLGPALDELREKLVELKGELRYLIGQGSPFAYVKGTPSAGLSGTGYVSVSEICGLLVELTTVPAGKGLAAGTPNRRFDTGRVNWGTADGYHAHVPIHESPQLVLGIPDVATRVGYTFPPGVVASITPISRSA